MQIKAMLGVVYVPSMADPMPMGLEAHLGLQAGPVQDRVYDVVIVLDIEVVHDQMPLATVDVHGRQRLPEWGRSKTDRYPGPG